MRWIFRMFFFISSVCVSREATAISTQTLTTPVKIRQKTARTPGAARQSKPLTDPYADCLMAETFLTHLLLTPLLQFVSSGGLQLLLEIFNSGILEPKDQESWTVVRNSPNDADVAFRTSVQFGISLLLFFFFEVLRGKKHSGSSLLF